MAEQCDKKITKPLASETNDRECPKNYRDDQLKWNGWGYKDSYFCFDPVNGGHEVKLAGHKYELCGQHFPDLPFWMENTLNSRVVFFDAGKEQIDEYKIPQPLLNVDLINFLKEKNFTFSIDGRQRVHRSHGHTLDDLATLRMGECAKRIPDVVIWPKNHQEVVDIVSVAGMLNFAIIPIGGGTSVTEALKCPKSEQRCIVSLDMGNMNHILWIDEKNMLARAEAGILGGALEKQLNEKGFTLGHEPDSMEFSTLGGWVATRASGIKKNKYGNIEDIVVNLTFVTPEGVIQNSTSAPRMSSGPDIYQLILGSEGTLGVVTEVTFKIFQIPSCIRHGSILFPNFDQGVQALWEMAKQRVYPASIRLMDNEQFQFGQALKPMPTIWTSILDYLKHLYVTKVKQFDWNKMAPATLLLEGSKEEVDQQERRVYEIAAKYGGFPAGSENARYGHMVTYMIAYLRDLAMDHLVIGESFETSVPWDKVVDLCKNVKELILHELASKGVVYPAYVSCRVPQIYDCGACVYFYLGFNYRNIEPDPGMEPDRMLEKVVRIYKETEIAARDEILRCGGSLSHHHGVGKIRKQWLTKVVGNVGMSVLMAVKQRWDPQNVFACGNLFNWPVDAKL